MAPIDVLLVDDEIPFVEALSKRLSKRDLEVRKAFGGKEALQFLSSSKGIDVILLDVKMPDMDGIETLQQIKKQYPLVEVIMLTGHATVETAIDGMKLGAFDYLMKPCELDVLVAKIKQAQDKKARHEQKIAEAQALNIALRRGD